MIDTRITLKAESKEQLNKLIDGKLKEGYLLEGGMQGGGQSGDQGDILQIMVQPSNIDRELTLAGGIKLLVMLAIYICVLYLIL